MNRQLLIALTLAVAGACGSRAQEPQIPPALRMELLIQNLDSESYTVRETASQELGELGEAALSVVEAALKHKSEEVRFRAAAILERLKVGPLLMLRKELAEYARSGEELDVEQGMFLL
ncbi:MAG: HEAT repeat domain-containing protein, partial [Planctomycetales bacterium]|nr:HEAT repeat domain-containing protein [Planctomycetales bacterium]